MKAIIGFNLKHDMQTPFFDYFITEHALFRNWDRSIDFILLTKVASHLKLRDRGKTIVIVTPSFISRSVGTSEKSDCLVLIFQDRALVTSFWNSNPEYLFSKEKESSTFKLLY